MSFMPGESPQECHALVFFVNGIKILERKVDPEVTLLQYLREKLCLRGTKLVCGEGGCGACTVMVSKLNRDTNKFSHFTINACIAPVCSMHGLSVTTVEGIGSMRKGLHPVQERLAKSHGSQCGFCSPGMVMTMYTLLRNNPLPSALQLEQAFDGNLCRCTGYRAILEGYKSFTKESCTMGDNCCRNTPATEGDVKNNKVSPELFDASEFTPCDQSQEPIFPPELQMTASYDKDTLVFVGEKVTWIRPVALEHLLELKVQYPHARLMDIGMDKMFYATNNPIMISTSHVLGLNMIEQGENGVSFGASVTISLVQEKLKDIIDTLPEYQTRTLHAIETMLHLFAGHQIRNVATIGGSLNTPSPVSDLNTLFMVTRTTALVQSKDRTKRTVKIDADFFTGFRKTVVKSEEVVISITIPYSEKNEYICGYKQSQRRYNDIAIVNAGMCVQLKPGTDIVTDILLSFGGMAATNVLARNTMEQVIGMRWNDDLLSRVCQLLSEDLPLSPEAPGGMAEYRRTLSLSFFFKFYLMVLEKICAVSAEAETPNNSTYRSAFSSPPPVSSRSCQVFEEVVQGQLSHDHVGRPCKTASADAQATGEVVYIDDMPRIQGELHACLVLSSKSHAKVLHVDPSEALNMPGVHDYVSHSDVTGKNEYCPDTLGEEIFASDMVYSEGQVIGVILADTHTHAQKAVRAVKIQYKEVEHIITCQEAIKASSYHGDVQTLENGDIDAGFADSDHILEGSYNTEGQEHFYFETQCCIALPNADGDMEVFSSTQNPNLGSISPRSTTESHSCTCEANWRWLWWKT